MSRPTEQILPDTFITEYNGQQVKWFIGDWYSRIGYWQAWGSVNGRAYQMGANFSWKTRALKDITVFKKTGIKEQDYYFDQETFDLLTK